MRFIGGGATRMTVTTSGINTTGSLSGNQVIISNGAAVGGRLRFISTNPTHHFMRNNNGTLEVYTAGGANMKIDAAGNAWFVKDVSAAVIEIRGAGNDIAEGLKINSAGQDVEPGMVVSISLDKPGEMELSSRPYQRTVAGIISGAGDRHVGLQLGNSEEVAAGLLTPVALTGQVWCFVDTSTGAVAPGDLLTTSATVGHAMKVSDYARAQGAVIGKAMTGLAQGEQGLVLVLVSLQ